jgi:hypothetical protein
MWKQVKDFGRYYRNFGREFVVQCYESWKSELRSTVGIAVITFVLVHGVDKGAMAVFALTAKAALVWLGLWAIYHLIRTPWKMSLKDVSTPANGFGEEIPNLAESLLDFIYKQLQATPQSPTVRFHQIGDDTTKFWDDLIETNRQTEAVKRHEMGTLGIYRYKFSHRVKSASKQLKTKGLQDETLDSLMADPQTSEQIKIVGERLRMLAEKLAESDTCIT